MKGYALIALALVAGGAAAETAVTTRATDMHEKARADAAKIATIEKDTKVDWLQRQGAWDEIRASGKSGWVRMSSLLLQGGTAAGGGSGLAGTYGRTTIGATSTTGVRGMTEEDIKNAEPNLSRLQEMERYKTTNEAGQSFARRNRITSIKFDYLKGVSSSSDSGAGQTPVGIGG